MYRRLAQLSAIVSLLVCHGADAPHASASCNIIPSTSSIGSPPPPGSGAAIPSDLPYRGAIGRIDRAYMVPGVTDWITIGADPNCAAPSMSAISNSHGGEEVDKDDVVVSLYFPARTVGAGQQIPVRRYAAEDICAELDAAAVGKGSDHVVWKPVERCSNDGVKVTNTPAGFRIRLPYPDPADATVGTVVAVVRRATGDAATRLRAVDRALLAADCAENSRHWIEEGATYACIDKLYLNGASTPLCALSLKAWDPWACQLGQLPSATTFSQQCECNCAVPTSPNCDCGSAQCAGSPASATSQWYVDNCKLKAIHAGFDWTGVFVSPSGRIVAGQAAEGRNGQTAQSDRVDLPGREFVASTAPGPSDPGDPRAPRLNVWYAPDRPIEAGLVGVVDKQASVLHIFPRFPVNRICSSAISNAEACLGVIEQDRKGVEKCVCDEDRPGTGCQCGYVDDTDHDVARFYACRGGAYEGRPCTRPAHCGPQGVCDGKPTCQRESEVWRPNAPAGSVACWDDEECPTTGNKPQCGYALFDFVAKIDPPVGPTNPRIVTLQRTITAVGKERRGVCKNDKTKACAKGQPCSSGDCLGYSLEAREKLP